MFLPISVEEVVSRSEFIYRRQTEAGQCGIPTFALLEICQVEASESMADGMN